MAVTRRGFLRGATGIAVGGALAGCGAHPSGATGSASAEPLAGAGAPARALQDVAAQNPGPLVNALLTRSALTVDGADGRRYVARGPGQVEVASSGLAPTDRLTFGIGDVPTWDFTEYFRRAVEPDPPAGSSLGVRIGRTDWGRLASQVEVAGATPAVLDAKGVVLPTLDLTAAQGMSAALAELATVAAVSLLYDCALDALGDVNTATVSVDVPGDAAVIGGSVQQMTLRRTARQRDATALAGGPDPSQSAFPLSAVDPAIALRCLQAVRAAGEDPATSVWITSSNGTDPIYAVDNAIRFDAQGSRMD